MTIRSDLFLAFVVALFAVPLCASGADESHSPALEVAPDTLRDEPLAVILNQPDAPMRLSVYEASYAGIRLFQSDGVRHEVDFINSGDRRIVAFKVKFVLYSVFKDPIGDRTGVLLEPLPVGASGSESWTHDPPNASTFHIGAVYIDKVRFGNGEIWESDTENIETQLTRLDEGQSPSAATSASRQ